MTFDLRSPSRLDADRYQFLRDEEVNTDPFYYPFWRALEPKLCRGEKMDALVDEWIVKKMKRDQKVAP